MIKLLIDDIELETVLETLTKLSHELSEKVLEQSAQLNKQRDQIEELKSQIIEMQSEGTKERRSLWDFLTGRNKQDSPNPSRIKESTVVLDK